MRTHRSLTLATLFAISASLGTLSTAFAQQGTTGCRNACSAKVFGESVVLCETPSSLQQSEQTIDPASVPTCEERFNARPAAITVSSTHAPSFAVDAAFDGSELTPFVPAYSDTIPSITIDLGTRKSLRGVKLAWLKGWEAKEVNIYTSSTRGSFRLVRRKIKTFGEVESFIDLTPLYGRFIKIEMPSKVNHLIALGEISVLAVSESGPTPRASTKTEPKLDLASLTSTVSTALSQVAGLLGMQEAYADERAASCTVVVFSTNGCIPCSNLKKALGMTTPNNRSSDGIKLYSSEKFTCVDFYEVNTSTNDRGAEDYYKKVLDEIADLFQKNYPDWDRPTAEQAAQANMNTYPFTVIFDAKGNYLGFVRGNSPEKIESILKEKCACTAQPSPSPEPSTSPTSTESSPPSSEDKKALKEMEEATKEPSPSPSAAPRSLKPGDVTALANQESLRLLGPSPSPTPGAQSGSTQN